MASISLKVTLLLDFIVWKVKIVNCIKKVLFIFLSLLPVFAWGQSDDFDSFDTGFDTSLRSDSTQVATQAKPLRTQSMDYFERITVYSNGRIVRFTEMPITIYVEPVPASPESGGTFLDDLNYALSEWEACSEGKIKFELTEKGDDANIRVIWAKSSLTARMDSALGDAKYLQTETGFRIEVMLSLRQRSGKLLSHEEMRNVCLHEFGHAIGLWGHSPAEQDIMFFATLGAQHPTEQDKNTLLKVYSHEPNHPQHEQALSVLKGQIEKTPKSPKLHYLLGSVYLDKGAYEQAVAAFNRCLELDSLYGQAREKLIQAYLKLDRKGDAIQQYDRLLKKNPSAPTYNSAGGLYYKQGDIEQAIKYFEKAFAMDKRYLPAKNNLFNVYKERGVKHLEAKDYDSSRSDFARAMALLPNDSGICDLMGAVYAGKGQYKQAIEYYAKAISINPGNTNARNNLAKAYNNLGVALVGQKKFEEAVEAYNKALAITPADAQFKSNLESAYWKMANHYVETKNSVKAIEAYRAVLKFNPDNKDAHFGIASTYYNLGRYPEAIHSFKRTLQIAPEDAEAKRNLFIAHFKYGQVLLEGHSNQNATTQFQEALNIKPGDTDTMINLGVTYQRAGQPAKALTMYEKALAIKADDDKIKRFIINLHTNLGNKYMRARKYKAAIAALEKIPEANRSGDISGSIGYLYIITKQPIAALPHLERALAENPKDDTSYQNLRAIESDFDLKLDKNDAPEIKTNLALTRGSLAKALMYKGNLPSAKAKLRKAIDLGAQSPVVKKRLIVTCMKLIEAFQAKKWAKNARQVAGWVLELDPENTTAKQILGG